MINRVLIRIKVVQMLYSYLLTRSDFNLATAPVNPSADRKYAYSLYLDLLLLVLELNGHRVSAELPEAFGRIQADKVLSKGAMARSLASVEQIRQLILRDGSSVTVFNDVISQIYDAIVGSAAYQAYAKHKNRDLQSDVEFWCEILSKLLSRLPALQQAARTQPGFTVAGYEQAFEMVVGTLMNYSDNRMLLNQAHNSLNRSLDMAHDLYMSLLKLICDLTRLAADRIEENRNKYLPSHEDLFPNTRFVDNQLAAALLNNAELDEFARTHSDMWLSDLTLLPRLMKQITDSEIYREYMEAPGTDWKQDCDLWRDLFKSVILPGDALAEYLESRSIFWNDDLEIMGTFVLKTIKQFANSPDHQAALQPKYKDSEDSRFGIELFDAAINGREEYLSLIDRYVDSRRWEAERLAFMDTVIMLAAIAEIVTFPSIPLQVSLSEYIEIAKNYSTERSGHFINGVLRSVIEHLRKEGKLFKALS